MHSQSSHSWERLDSSSRPVLKHTYVLIQIILLYVGFEYELVRSALVMLVEACRDIPVLPLRRLLVEHVYVELCHLVVELQRDEDVRLRWVMVIVTISTCLFIYALTKRCIGLSSLLSTFSTRQTQILSRSYCQHKLLYSSNVSFLSCLHESHL